MRHDHSIAMLCENLQVSTRGFYDWDARRSAPGPRAVENLALADEIVAIHAHSRRMVGWAMSPTIDSALVLSALSMATLHRSPLPGLLFHSDRGVQYAAGDFRAALKAAGFLASMSRRGNCYDNASMESFWSTLKLGLVYRTHFATRRQARSEIFDFIEAFYNRQRSHTSLGGLSPADFELKNNSRRIPFSLSVLSKQAPRLLTSSPAAHGFSLVPAR